jgi:hypothetical protein
MSPRHHALLRRISRLRGALFKCIAETEVIELMLYKAME